MRLVKFSLYNDNIGIIECPDIIGALRDKLSVVNEGAVFAQQKYKHYPSRLYAITPSGRFDVGLFKTIKQTIDSMGIPVEYSYSSEFKDSCIPRFEYHTEPLPVLNITPYDYQETAVRRMLSFGRGTVLVATGGGKTFIMSLFAKTVMNREPKTKFLIMVPTLQLVSQTYADFIDYGFREKDISMWSGKCDRKDTPIIVANVGILQSKVSDLSFLSDIDVLIIDEVHIVKKSNKINKVINRMKTTHRYGFTGTLPEDVIDQWNVFGKTGPILFEKDSDTLRKGKFLSDAKIDIIRVNYNMSDLMELHDLLDATTKKYSAEMEFVIGNEYRNKLLSHTAKITRGNTLIMVDRIIHGETLYDTLNGITDKQVFFIQGDVDVDEREKIRDIMEEHSDVICIAISKIFSTGINIKNIHNIVFATPGKAKVKLIQSIGRGLRLHASKTELRVIDFADNLHYSSRHLEKRQKLYTTEKFKYETRNIKQPTERGG